MKKGFRKLADFKPEESAIHRQVTERLAERMIGYENTFGALFVRVWVESQNLCIARSILGAVRYQAHNAQPEPEPIPELRLDQCDCSPNCPHVRLSMVNPDIRPVQVNGKELLSCSVVFHLQNAQHMVSVIRAAAQQKGFLVL